MTTVVFSCKFKNGQSKEISRPEGMLNIPSKIVIKCKRLIPPILNDVSLEKTDHPPLPKPLNIQEIELEFINMGKWTELAQGSIIAYFEEK